MGISVWRNFIIVTQKSSGFQNWVNLLHLFCISDKENIKVNKTVVNDKLDAI